MVPLLTNKQSSTNSLSWLAVHTFLTSRDETGINRAELVGILFAVQAGSHLIATDSMTSMHQIRKQLLRPQDLEQHKHQDLIKAIDTLIRASTEPIHLYKVPAHQGVVGNEHADEIAKAAAKGRAPAADFINMMCRAIQGLTCTGLWKP